MRVDDGAGQGDEVCGSTPRSPTRSATWTSRRRSRPPTRRRPTRSRPARDASGATACCSIPLTSRECAGRTAVPGPAVQHALLGGSGQWGLRLDLQQLRVVWAAGGAGAVRQLRAGRLRVSVVSWLYLRPASTWELSRQSGLCCKFFGLICDGSSSCTRHSNRFVVAILLSDKVFARIHRGPRLAARSAQRGAEETGTAQALPCSRSSTVSLLFFSPKM